MKDFPKKFSHEFEQDIYKQWTDADAFSHHSQTETEWTFMIAMPPPNVTGVLHIGHAMMLTVEDAMVRTARMKWKKTNYIPWTDHASISTQVVVERKLEEKWIDPVSLWRTGFLSEVWKWVEYSRSTIISQTKRMWTSCDRSQEQFTLSEHLSRSVRKAFVKLYNEWKIYKSQYMINRSPKAKTVLSDLEVNFKEKEGKMYYIKYFVDGKWKCITVATARPETIFADVAVAVHPKDKRYKKRIGKHVLIPLINRSIPIIADESVDMHLWTGALKITPTHAEVDYEIAKRHDLSLEYYAINKDGTFSDLAWENFAGKDVYEFEENFVQHLNEIGNIEKIEDHVHSVPYCERTWCRVQPLLSTQWFMDVSWAAQKILMHLDDKHVTIHPNRFEKTFRDRLENIRPRCISRQLRWGHRIPVWYDEAWEMIALDEDEIFSNDKNLKDTLLSRIIFNVVADSRLSNPFSIEQCIEVLFSPSLVPQYSCVLDAYISIYRQKFVDSSSVQKLLDQFQEISDMVSWISWNDKSAKQKALISWGEKLIDLLDKSEHIVASWDTYRFIFDSSNPKKVYTQEEDVLDTRFSSGLWPFSVLWRPEKTPDLESFYPNSVLETWYDIIFFRVIRMMIMWVELTDQLPFSDVYLHGLVRDKKWKKMSKSIWNVLNPLDLIEKYGTDALRWSLLAGNTPWNDMKFAEEKVEYMWKFINKMRNASRFVLSKIDLDDEWLIYEDLQQKIVDNYDELNSYDQRIYSKTQTLIEDVDKYQEKFMQWEALQQTITVMWHDFCDRYIEISKIKVSDHTNTVLLYCLWTYYKLLHPCLPFVTEKLRQHFWFTGQLITSKRPVMKESWKKNYRMNLLMEMISHWRRLRGEVTNKKHEHVDLFVHANKDIHDLVSSHDLLVRDILHVDEIIYVHSHEEVEWDWNTAMVMDIKLWLRGKAAIDKRAVMKDLQKQLDQEEQFLQRLRNMFAGDFMQKAPDHVVAEKKTKMTEIKLKVQHLEAEIRKIKLHLK